MFVALGFSEIDLDRAWTEVESLFAGQWKNGMAAHIVFRQKAPSYFPGPDVWRAGDGLPTSGVFTTACSGNRGTRTLRA